MTSDAAEAAGPPRVKLGVSAQRICSVAFELASTLTPVVRGKDSSLSDRRFLPFGPGSDGHDEVGSCKYSQESGLGLKVLVRKEKGELVFFSVPSACSSRTNRHRSAASLWSSVHRSSGVGPSASWIVCAILCGSDMPTIVDAPRSSRGENCSAAAASGTFCSLQSRSILRTRASVASLAGA